VAPHNPHLTRDQRPQAQASQGAQGFSGIGFVDIIKGLARHWLRMVFVFVILSILVVLLAWQLPKTYETQASLLVKLGSEYVYLPSVGDAARGATTNSEEVVQSEAEIIQSGELHKRVIKKIGFQRLFPKDKKLANPKSASEIVKSESAAMKMIAKKLLVTTSPKNNVIRIYFSHAESMTAAAVVNVLIEEYLKYRSDVFLDQRGPVLLEQKSVFDRRLNEANQSYQQFLLKNNVVDFTTAKTSYGRVYDQVLTDLFATEAQVSQLSSRKQSLKALLQSQNPEINIERSIDLTLPSRIRELKSQRAELLTRYLPGSEPVIVIDSQIKALEQRLGEDGLTDREVKLGRSKSYDDLLTAFHNAEADLASAQSRKQELDAQAKSVMARMQELAKLEYQNNSLATERDALMAQIRDFSTRIEEANANSALKKNANDVVRVISPAIAPPEGTSLRRLAALAGIVVALGTALMVGFVSTLLDMQKPKGGRLAEELDLPVLAKAAQKG